MPRQQLLQGFHKGTIEINSTVSILSKDGMTTYFVGGDNYSFHFDGDEQSRRRELAQLMLNRHARPVEIERSALGIPRRTLMNWQRKFQDGGGAAAFFRAPARGHGPVLTPQKTLECRWLLAGRHALRAQPRRAHGRAARGPARALGQRALLRARAASAHARGLLQRHAHARAHGVHGAGTHQIGRAHV